MLKINNLSVKVEGLEENILKELNLEIKKGETHANYGTKWFWKKYISKSYCWTS